jgi:hypothetical protein
MDTALVLFLTALWGLTIALAWTTGWARGWEHASEEHRWHRWFVRREENRITKI